MESRKIIPGKRISVGKAQEQGLDDLLKWAVIHKICEKIQIKLEENTHKNKENF